MHSIHPLEGMLSHKGKELTVLTSVAQTRGEFQIFMKSTFSPIGISLNTEKKSGKI